jgi:general secretion pathway protein G
MIHTAQIANRKSQIATSKAGFTLVELLLVIAIIGILASVISVNFVGIRQRARDSQRKSDIRQIQSAVELYRVDNGSYPVRTSTYRINSGSTCPAVEAFIDSGTTYMSKVPCDPSGSSGYNAGNYYYSSDASGTTYLMSSCLENANDGDSYTTATAPSPSANGTCSSGKYYSVTNP